MSRDHHDILIDQLLREILGGDRPRDLTVRVLAHAKSYDRIRRRWWVGAASGLAAAIALGVTLWMFRPHEYPSPVIDGTVLTDTEEIKPGTNIETSGDDQASVALGGYVKFEMGPDTALQLGGEKYAEKVYLDHGDMDVAVTKNRGKFDVAVGPALVHVTGTRFRLHVREQRLPEEGRRIKVLEVRVNEGSVVVSGVGGQPVTLLAASGLKTFEIASEPLRRNFEHGQYVPPTYSSAATGPAAVPTARGGGAGRRGGIGRTPPRSGPLGSTFTRGLGAGRMGAGRGETTPTSTEPPRQLTTHLLIPHGNFVLDGYLRRDADLYFLEAKAGTFELFPQQLPPTHMPLPGTYVYVLWHEGIVDRVEPKDPPSNTSTNTPTTQPAP